MSAHNLDYYLKLNYTYQLRWDPESEAYGAHVLELPGCIATGDTSAEAMKALDEAKHAYLEVALAEGWNIPEPADVESFSGRVLVRMAQSLHMQLVQWAEQEGTSLNQIIVTALAHAAGSHLLQPLYSPPHELTSESIEILERDIIQARQQIEAGLECEQALALLRSKLIASYDTSPSFRPLLSLVDLVSQAYRLAEIRASQRNFPTMGSAYDLHAAEENAQKAVAEDSTAYNQEEE